MEEESKSICSLIYLLGSPDVELLLRGCVPVLLECCALPSNAAERRLRLAEVDDEVPNIDDDDRHGSAAEAAAGSATLAAAAAAAEAFEDEDDDE